MNIENVESCFASDWCVREVFETPKGVDTSDGKRGDLFFYQSCGSTSDEAKAALKADLLPRDALFLAREQTGGYGRLQRSWFSEVGSCLTFTLVIHVPELIKHPGRLSLLCGWSLADALCVLGLRDEVDIKWPNDLHLEGKKVAGTLIESRADSRGLVFLIGIGLNVGVCTFPDEIRDIATTLANHLDETPSPLEVLQIFLERFELALQNSRSQGWGGMLQNYREHSSWVSGKRIRYEQDGKTCFATTKDIDDSGALWVLDESGEEQRLNISEIFAVREERS